MMKLPSSSWERISATIRTHSASGIIGSYSPAMSKSCKNNRLIRTKDSTHPSGDTQMGYEGLLI